MLSISTTREQNLKIAIVMNDCLDNFPFNRVRSTIKILRWLEFKRKNPSVDVILFVGDDLASMLKIRESAPAHTFKIRTKGGGRIFAAYFPALTETFWTHLNNLSEGEPHGT
ncbi:hypothetical protein C4588_01065 [Candidatus Parcubacteria bacterium]|nr:MAG: hypothetical protein C4588_01065 [Candidatus Parcubacteria bacterium]